MRLGRSREKGPAESGTGAASGAGAENGAETWIAPPPRAALATTATKAVLWGLVGCGPVALLAVAANPASSDGRPVAAETRRSAAGPSGFAELYVAAYLSTGNGDTALKAFFPEAPAISTPPGQRTAGRTITTDAREAAPGYWSVTVAADVAAKDKNGVLTATGVHYFQVAVIASGDETAGGTRPKGTTPGYVATALPAEVSAPAPGTVPELAYDTQRQITSGPLADTVRQALAAYLGGAGDLSRYLTPGTSLRPVVPAPYRQVELSGITLSKKLPDADTTVPADGTRARVLAKVDVTDGAGLRWPLTYALTMTARAGRWELTVLDAAPVLGASRPGSAGRPPPAPTPTSTTGTGTGAPTGTGSPTPSSSAPSGSAPARTPDPSPGGGTAPTGTTPQPTPSNRS
ncbi:conjugal transfer protein [Spirillospora sp. NBC_00431]